jgi:hypothetical protein
LPTIKVIKQEKGKRKKEEGRRKKEDTLASCDRRFTNDNPPN